MITWIGLCAGEVWHYLDAHSKEASMQVLLSGIKAPKETVWMAVGWLAREGKIEVQQDKRSTFIWLTE